jgi:hypothetical protein
MSKRAASVTTNRIREWSAVDKNLAVMHRLFQKESRSLAQFVSETSPWMHREDREAQDLLNSIITDERRWANQLARMIIERGSQPISASYPDRFIHSNLHYVALDYLMQRIAEYLDGAVASIQSDLSATINDAVLRQLLEQMVERKGGQATALRRLAASMTPAKTRSH